MPNIPKESYSPNVEIQRNIFFPVSRCLITEAVEIKRVSMPLLIEFKFYSW